MFKFNEETNWHPLYMKLKINQLKQKKKKKKKKKQLQQEWKIGSIFLCWLSSANF